MNNRRKDMPSLYDEALIVFRVNSTKGNKDYRILCCMNQHMESFVRVAPLRNQRKGPEDPARPGGPVLVTLQSVK